MYPEYLNIRIGSKRRLASLKRAAEKLNASHNARKANGDATPYTWRDVRYSGFHNAATNCATLSRGFNGDTPIWYCHTESPFTHERYVDEVADRIQHRGWYADIEGHSLIRGLVVALPNGRFLAGYYQSDNGESVYFHDVYDCEIEAAYAADSEAESIAELEREHDYLYQQARKLEFEIEDNIARLKECLALRNNACFKHLRDDARELIAAIRDSRDTLETEYAEYI